MRYSPVHPDNLEGEDFAHAAANRSATLAQLDRPEATLQDIDLAIEAGYPVKSQYKLYIRKCKCLLQLGRIAESQTAFDEAVDAIDKSGLKKDMRKGLAVELQEAFIQLVKDDEEANAEKKEDEAEEEEDMPSWTILKDPHPIYPAASSSITIKHDPTFGRHVVATKPIATGEVVFRESPIVSYMNPDDDYSAAEACDHCFSYITAEMVTIPCPTCSAVVFCSLKCRRKALDSYHFYECRLGPFFR